MTSLSNKTAIITGSPRGLGKEIAQELAKQGTNDKGFCKGNRKKRNYGKFYTSRAHEHRIIPKRKIY